jgi:Zn-dependent M28 family amino/carboxypeptidase
MPVIDTARVLADTRTLSSDEFEGRAPGSKGEDLTVKFLIDRFKDAGALPGNPDGTWVQKVPLVGITSTHFSPLVVQKGSHRIDLAPREDVVAFSSRVTESIDVSGSEIVFAGYGVQAPEYQWDDFKGMDVRGKTLIVLVSDPPVPLDPAKPDELDPKMFNGRAMTYYGRWTYKYEKAAALGAAAVLIVHETGPAGYPFNVVQGFGGERFGLVTPDRNMRRAAIEGWLSLDAAKRLFALAGLDFTALKDKARTRDFAPIPLGATMTMSFTQTLRTIQSQNVLAKIPGADPAVKDEYVIFTSHWDHLGVGTPVNGDAIYNGARDNASGCAMLVEFARAFTHIVPRPRRSILLAAVTGEESGLLGSEYYATFPPYPLSKTLAAINMDEVNVWGPTSDFTVIGLGASDLDQYAQQIAAEQGRVIRPDAEPEKGYYYRSDHFNFAKVGVPALSTDTGMTFVGKPPGYGQQKREEWTTHDYHQPSDEVKDWWDLSGAALDGQLLFAVGYRVANADRFPAWAPGSEFRAAREKMLGR